MKSRPAWYGDPDPLQRRALDRLAALSADTAFTEALHCPALERSVSAVIATFNRCPFDPGTSLADNPLYWAVTSLRAQAGQALAEIVVVDDGSADHTGTVLDHLTTRDHQVPIRAVRLGRHRGAWHARNTGAAAARSRWLYYADDDCVFAPHVIAGAAYALSALQEHDPAAGAVMTPFYYRALRPSAVLPRQRIGVLNVTTGDFATGFHAIPSTFLAGKPPTLGPAGLLGPLPVALIGGTVLIDAAALAKAGGFADLSAWHSGYSDHLHLSADLTDAGTRMYHCPDPRLSAAHLKFGATGSYRTPRRDLASVVPALGRPFAHLVNLSAAPREQTGHRLPDARFFPEQIGSFFAFFAGRSAAGARTWALRSWRDFVQDGAAPTLAVTGVPPLQARIAAWRGGLARGAAFLATTARPSMPRDQIRKLLREVTDACDQPPLTDW